MDCLQLKAAPKFANTVTDSGLEKQPVHAGDLQWHCFIIKMQSSSERRTEVSAWGWWRWAGQAASRERGPRHCCRGADLQKLCRAKVYNAISLGAAPVKASLSEPMDRNILSLLSTSPLNLMHRNKMWPGYCPFFSLFAEDCWLVSCSCQLLLSWLAHLRLLVVHRTALESSHKDGFSDDVWSPL